MPNKRTRERQLAKQAARRQAARDAARRRSSRTRAGIVLLLVAGLLVAGGLFFFGGKGDEAAQSPSPSGPVSPSTQPKGPPKQIGAIVPVVQPPEKVACGGTKPHVHDHPKFSNAPPANLEPDITYVATVSTSCGSFKIKLLQNDSPQGASNFVFLAKRGFYDGTTFHRLVKDFVIQGGDPKGDGTGGPGYEFPIESTPNVPFDSAGVVAYAHSSTGGNGSQFFVTLAPTPQLNPTPQASYTIFGKVIAGMDVVNRIAKVPTQASPTAPTGEKSEPTQAVYIDTIKVTSKKSGG